MFDRNKFLHKIYTHLSNWIKEIKYDLSQNIAQAEIPLTGLICTKPPLPVQKHIEAKVDKKSNDDKKQGQADHQTDDETNRSSNIRS